VYALSVQADEDANTCTCTLACVFVCVCVCACVCVVVRTGKQAGCNSGTALQCTRRQFNLSTFAVYIDSSHSLLTFLFSSLDDTNVPDLSKSVALSSADRVKARPVKK
jgi:hypothetical protein